MEKLKKVILNHDVDLTALTEINKDWRNIQYEETIWGATATWREHRRVQASYNVTEQPCKRHQVGGTAMILLGDLTFRLSHQSVDFRKLGRWSLVTLTGKNNVNTTIITCYCPNRSPSLGSAYSQHLLYMAKNKENIPAVTCPRQLFGQDLKAEIGRFLDKGHSLIVMGDFNSQYDLLSSWMLDAGLCDLIAARHGVCPITCKKSAQDPIDVIFGSPNLKISKGGLLSFGKLMSDHRGLWIDIPKFLIYGYNPIQPVFPSARRLKLQDPRVVTKYLTCLHTLMQDNDLFMKMDALHRNATTPLSQRMIDEYESLDFLVCRLMDESERQCRKLRTGSIPWSPAYKQACLLLEYWYKRRSYVKREHTNVRELIVLQKKLNMIYDPNLSLMKININIKEAHKKRKQCKEKAESLSLEYRTQLAVAKEEAGQGSAATILRNMNNIEASRRLFRNIRQMEGKLLGGCTSKLTTTINGVETEHTDKTDIDTACAAENQRKYHLTEGGTSQFLTERFIQDLGHHGEGKEVQNILNGTYTAPHESTQATIDFLAACKTDPTTLALSTPNNVIDRYKLQRTSWDSRKEKTTTYNQSMAHYKAIFSDDFVSWFFFQRADITEMTGYSPKRHRTCVDLMIMKKHMCFDIKKQRTLGILDTEFNQCNKRIGRDGMNLALQQNKIAKEQFAVKNSAAPEQIVSKRAVLDHSQYMRKIILLTSADLEACYDRIIHTAAALALLRVGISHKRINTMFQSIQLMIHRIRTLFGDSDITWGGEDLDDIQDWENYPQGVLQGNTAGPTIWSLLSSIIFEILHKRGFAVEFCTAISKELFCLVGFAYVDDSDLIQTGSDPVQVLNSMQKLINSWGELIDVTGGAISIEKSWWYMIDYVWKRGKWIAVDADNNLDLVAKSSTGDFISLKRLHAYESSKMLGIYVTPDGNKDELIKDLKTAAITWGTKMRCGHSNKVEAWTALHTNISAKLKYPLPACTLNEAECKSIMWPALKAALPKAGISSYISTAYRDGPRDYGGAGCLSLFHCQGTTRTSMVIELVKRKTPAGFFLLLCIEDMVLDTGVYGSLWKMDFTQISKYIQTHSLMYHMWEYNTKNDIEISVQHAELEPQREGDISLMKLAQQHFHRKTEIRSIQRVRMKLGIIHLSDITTADGKKMEPKFYSTSLPTVWRNKYDWPIKHFISREDIARWRKFLKYIFEGDNGSLINPLGEWIDMTSDYWVDNWDYFQTENKEFLYHRIGDNLWHRHIQRPFSHRAYNIQYLELREITSQDLRRVTVLETPVSLMVTATCRQSAHIEEDVPIAFTFGNIKILKPRNDWFTNYVTATDTTDNLWMEILEDKAFAVSDGSFFPTSHTGACAWIISTRDGSEWIKGGGIIPGCKEDQDPYRSELGGQVGLAAFISAIVLPDGMKPNITIACDGLAALNRVHMQSNIIKANMTNVDLISIISEIWDDSKFTITKQHVYGHQDKLGRTLSQLETLNCIVDDFAKEIATKRIDGLLLGLQFSSTDVGFGTVKCNGKLITSNLQRSLYKEVTKKKFLDALCLNTEMPLDTSTVNVHWESFRIARKESPLSTQTFMTKWISGDTATGRVMVKRQDRILAKCPLCSHEDEHLLHVMTCKSTSATALRNNLFFELGIWLESINTAPAIVNAINLGLSGWIQCTAKVWANDDEIFTHDEDTDKAIRSQIRLGWYYFMCGFQTTEIVELQQVYYSKIKSQKRGTRWAATVTKKMWKILLQLWKHRCGVLHTTNAIHQLSGLQQLRSAITAEYTLGRGDLPGPYSSFFHIPLSSLLKKDVNSLKRWFLIVRTAREAHTIIGDLDDFSFDGPLRTWIGLIDNG